ncbi:MAG: fibrobacter succinogenes major paralogous domain-containing protein [Bacteroides sp.]|nr:fibrobacter succinogenes major paralogous domain-containing protein [Roseburia sp.]MCM1347016.1 fibrobacter succinogenes major paralogous domain-containing protein [Bacteroides sp.]MCM1421535.1 fibrobacter succinogenes major paralogous domain-containing protein [Bacteroides sp.]
MRKSIVFLLAMVFAACTEDEKPGVPESSATGTMQDKEGNTYRWVRIDSLDWMAENLHSGIRWYRQGTAANPKFSYSDSTVCARQFDIFGNYYSYTEALAQCPEGWRLPTDDDWKCLERAFGMSKSEADKTGWRKGAARMLAQSSETAAGINLRYGGELVAFFSSDIELYHVYDYGLYWSSTLDTLQLQKCAYIRKITPALDEVERVATPTASKWMSVRYVRNAQ